MLISTTLPVAFAMYNRQYAKRQIDAKNVKMTFYADRPMPFDMTRLTAEVTNWLDINLRNCTVIQKDDPYLIHLLEPKDGNTVHTLLDKIRGNNVSKTAVMLGTKNPPETLNGHRILVLGEGYTATMEGVLEYILRSLTNLNSIQVADGGHTMELRDSDLNLGLI